MTFSDKLSCLFSTEGNRKLLSKVLLELLLDQPCIYHLILLHLLCLFFQGLPLVIKGMTFSIPGGTRVGIAGRTGCGKSSLIQVMSKLRGTNQM
jgi:ABC-type bacteriocin/lantibiotic exporter with double-glycine peptidase domain